MEISNITLRKSSFSETTSLNLDYQRLKNIYTATNDSDNHLDHHITLRYPFNELIGGDNLDMSCSLNLIGNDIMLVNDDMINQKIYIIDIQNFNYQEITQLFLKNLESKAPENQYKFSDLERIDILRRNKMIVVVQLDGIRMFYSMINEALI